MHRLALCLFFVLIASSGSAPIWNVAIDSRTEQQWVAESPNTVFAVQNEHVIAIDSATGTIRWRSEAQSEGGPAYARGSVAIPIENGIVFVDAQSGHERARLRFDDTPTLSGSSSNIVALLPRDAKVVGCSPSGTIVWTRDYGTGGLQRLLHLRDNAVAVQTWRETIVIDAQNGNAVAVADGADEIVGFDGRYLWFTVLQGGVKALDLDTNRSIALHNSIVRNAVRVEHGIAVAVVDGRLKTIDLSSGKVEPLRIDGRWVGGPLAGKIFIERGDGLYIQDIRSPRAHLLARFDSDVALMASDGRNAIAGLRDGTVLVIDAQTNRVLSKFASGCDFYEGFAARAKTMLVHCDKAQASHLLAFDRPVSS